MKKLLVVLFMVISLPVAASMVGETHQASQFVAIAGHTQVGGSCDCGDAGCICDPGEKLPRVVVYPSNPVKPGKPERDGGGLLLWLAIVALVLRVALTR